MYNLYFDGIVAAAVAVVVADQAAHTEAAVAVVVASLLNEPDKQSTESGEFIIDTLYVMFR